MYIIDRMLAEPGTRREADLLTWISSQEPEKVG